MIRSAITPARILEFWFEESGPAKWYKVSSAFDARMRRLFASQVEAEAARFDAGNHPWLENAGDALALILLFDQFPRNIWRGSGRAFAYDDRARQISRDMIARGFDWAIEPTEQRAFVYLPFMHSERIEDQDYCVELAADRLPTPGTHGHALKHREVIRQFGRFPYRNDALQRVSTQAEIDYLAHGGYAPGRNDSAKKA